MFSNSLSSRQIDPNKAEQELAQAIKKATSIEESAPKQKHVRTCIVFTQDFKSSRSFWSGMQSQPLSSDEVQCFKALITIHKVIRDGHPNVLRESFNEVSFIQSLGRNLFSNDNFGYGPLIRGYIEYILNKLDFHRQNPEFPANFDYDDYLSMRGVSDPNAGYETIGQLISLAERQDGFHRQVFRSLGGSPNNECKISCLVPLVQESFAIYTFIKSMLTAMYQSIEIKEALVPLKNKFYELHENNRQFYFECSQIRYLTSLITVPELSKDPPSFVPGEPSRRLEVTRNSFFYNNKKNMKERLQQQRAYEEQQQQEELQRMQQNQIQRQVHEIFNLRARHERDQLLYQQNQGRSQQLEREIQLKTIQLNQQEQNNQVNMWKSKYEVLAKSYAQLPTSKLGQAGEATQTKAAQVTQMATERDPHQEEMNRLRRESEMMRSQLNELGQSKGAEVAQLMQRFEREKQNLNQQISIKMKEMMELQGELNNLRVNKDEEINVLQAAMDQTLIALKQTQDSTNQTSTGFQRKLLNKILDSIFRSCIEKMDQSIFDFESTNAQEHALSLIETILYDYLSDHAEHSEVISLAINFTQLSDQLLAEDNMVELLTSETLLSDKLSTMANKEIQSIKDASTLEIKNSMEDLGDLVEREMLNAAKAIEEATMKLSTLMNKPMDPKLTTIDRQVHSSILDSAMAITNAIAHLIKCATASQQEIVTQGKGSSTKTAFYKKNNRWTEGLISAAKAVAMATNYLVESADGVIHGTHSLEQLMVACNEVSAATAQLVAASRVKASLHSKTQNQLEEASKAVTNASKGLVKAVKALSEKQQSSSMDLSNVAPHEFKVKEMEQQVSILKLEKELAVARAQLAQMRKHSYHYSNEVEEQ
ncbi:hypothetical protein K502DRAFT_335785 [Neoconidiobolus thromboides FSU 785]|nr:hypothetical protein K502DRAFT_335785 [Neoconidiobolus thromboides FSU 785]